MPEITDKIMREAENKHYDFQTGCYFSDSKNIRGALLLRSDTIKDFYWNYATKVNVSESNKESVIKKIISFYKEKNLQPSIYITPQTKPGNLAEYAKQVGFKSVSKEAWMFYGGKTPIIELPENFRIKQVKTKEEMKLFVDVFHQAYGGATPDEPYGALPKEYGECLYNSFVNSQKTDEKNKKSKTNKTINYLAMLNGIAAGVATLIFSEKFGCIYGVGTVPAHRGKGIGALLTLNAVADSIKNKAEIVFLQTEKGSATERYYCKLGFSAKFIAESFLLDELSYGAYQAVNACVKLKSNERTVVITDLKTKAVAEHVISAIRRVTSNLETYVLEDYGKRPYKIPSFIISSAIGSDVVFVIADYVYGDMSLLYEPLDSAVAKSKARMAAMVGINEQLMRDGMNADYEKISKFSKKLYRIVRNAKKVRVVTDLGTDITITLGYKWAVFDGIPGRGKWVNLPDGEVLTTPKNINGRVVADGIIEFLGLLGQNPLHVEIKDGFARKDTVFCGQKEIAKKFSELVFTEDENSCRVGEFAFGTNLFLKKLCGEVLQDEKFPSIHIAFGDPHGSLTGAKWKSKNHMDAIILNPTVFVDGRKVMEKGRYLI